MNPWEIDMIEILIRLALALFLGGAIGLEREQSNRAAGLRTNILVCVGSALIMLISMYGFADFAGHTQADPARLAAQVVSGIGFLGAGVILFNGFSVTGLTTAATLWVVAGIGLAAGAGFYIPAVATTLIVLFSLLILNKVEAKWLRHKALQHIRIKSADRPGIIGDVSAILNEQKADLRRISVERLKGEIDGVYPPVMISITVKMNRSLAIPMIERLGTVPDVTDVALE